MPKSKDRYELKDLKDDDEIWKRFAMSKGDSGLLENVFKDTKENPFAKNAGPAMERLQKLAAEGKLYVREYGRARHFRKVEMEGEELKLGEMHDRRLARRSSDPVMGFLMYLSSGYFNWLGINWLSKWFDKRLERRRELLKQDEQYKTEYDALTDEEKKDLKALRKHEKQEEKARIKLEKLQKALQKAQEEYDRIRGLSSPKPQEEKTTPTQTPTPEQEGMAPPPAQTPTPEQEGMAPPPAQTPTPKPTENDMKPTAPEDDENQLIDQEETPDGSGKKDEDPLIDDDEGPLIDDDEGPLIDDDEEPLIDDDEEPLIGDDDEEPLVADDDEEPLVADDDEEEAVENPEEEQQPLDNEMAEPLLGDEEREAPEGYELMQDEAVENPDEPAMEDEEQEAREDYRSEMHEPLMGEEEREAPEGYELMQDDAVENPNEQSMEEEENDHESYELMQDEENAHEGYELMQDEEENQVEAEEQVQQHQEPANRDGASFEERLAAEATEVDKAKNWREQIANSLFSHEEAAEQKQFYDSIKGQREVGDSYLAQSVFGVLANNAGNQDVVDGVLSGRSLGSQHDRMIQNAASAYQNADVLRMSGNPEPMATLLANAIRELSRQASRENSLSPRHMMIGRLISNAVEIAEENGLNLPLNDNERYMAQGATQMAKMAQDYFDARQYLGRNDMDMTSPQGRDAVTTVMAANAMEKMIQRDHELGQTMTETQYILGRGVWTSETLKDMANHSDTRKRLTIQQLRKVLESPNSTDALTIGASVSQDIINESMGIQLADKSPKQRELTQQQQREQQMPTA